MDVSLDLITACINKERRAEFELYKTTYSYLMSICVRYTKSREEAKEQLNVGFVKIILNLDKYKPEVPFRNWIRKVLINSIIDEYRREFKHKSTIEYKDEYTENSLDINLNSAISKINIEHLNSLITQLPTVSRTVFNLYIIEGYNHKEISDLLGMKEGTSKWHLNFSRNKLKEMLSKINHEKPIKA